MNNITAKPFGAAEHCAMDNWAAEYAKKLFISEAASRTADIAAEAQSREAADNILRDEYKAADKELDDKKLDRDEYATETTAGIVTLHRGGSGNNSGLLVGEKGELSVNVSPDGRFGLTRDGAGQIKTYPATETEIAAGTDAYKPIVPKTLRSAVESITGKSANLNTITKASLVAAVNEILLRLGGDLLDIDVKSSMGLPITSVIPAINRLYEMILGISGGSVGVIDNASIKMMSTGGTKQASTGMPAGIYFWVPDEKINEFVVSIDTVKYTDGNGKGMFKPGYMYIIQTGSNGRVLYSEYEEKKVGSYNTSPIMVGTWTDDTPVWRVAIPMTAVSEIGCNNPKGEWRLNVIRILASLNIIDDSSEVFYIDDRLIFQNSNDYDIEAYACNCALKSPGYYEFSASETEYATHFYGWIEFATSKSNIKI